MTPVSNDDRISAALLRLEQAERLVMEARRIFSYAEKQQENRQEVPQTRGTRSPTDSRTNTTRQEGPRGWELNEPIDGLYPGQKGYIEEPECEE